MSVLALSSYEVLSWDVLILNKDQFAVATASSSSHLLYLLNNLFILGFMLLKVPLEK